MKRNRTTLVLPLAGLLLVVGAGAALATSGAGGPDTTTAVIPAAESASPGASSGATVTPDQDPDKARDTVLTEVLDDLVAKGTITDSQKTAILDGLAAERTARREAAQAQRQQLKDFLADGQITQDELDQLPEEQRSASSPASWTTARSRPTSCVASAAASGSARATATASGGSSRKMAPRPTRHRLRASPRPRTADASGDPVRTARRNTRAGRVNLRRAGQSPSASHTSMAFPLNVADTKLPSVS